MRLPPLSFIVLDTETTGFVPRVHRVIELAFVHVEKGKTSGEHEELFSIDDQIPPHVQVLTRIRPTHLAGKPGFKERSGGIRGAIPEGALLVGQNLGFDLDMLKGEGLDLTAHPWIDTSMLASLVFPELASYSLGYLSVVLKLHHEPVHRALGDVHATLELLGRCWERLCILPPEHIRAAKEIFGKSTEGYRRLFEALPAKGGDAVPWPHVEDACRIPCDRERMLPLPTAGTVELREEGLEPRTLQRLVNAAAKAKKLHWFAVKNIDACLRRLSVCPGVRVLYPPSLLLDPDAAARLRAQASFTAEEATLAVKLAWFAPRTRADLPIHGNEKDVWNGKLACTPASAAYTEQFTKPPAALLLDHRQLLEILADQKHPARAALKEEHHVIVDDASMLEDTATKAFGVYCPVGDLRAAAQGDKDLMKFTDLLQLWIERTRRDEDVRFLHASDMGTPEASGLVKQASALRARTDLVPRTLELLSGLARILSLEDGFVGWIEIRQNGAQILQSVPEHVDARLKDALYARFRTTLLVPQGAQELPEILPPRFPTSRTEDEEERLGLPIMIAPGGTAEDLLKNPPPGKTIILLPSKRSIEGHFVKYMEALEQRDVTLICQGLSGGQGRMEAEFIAAEGTALWLLTPWTYEGIDLPTGTAQHLVFDMLPFDHPSQPVLQIRADHHRDSFSGYMLPRLEHRLFRLLRTFCRHRTDDGDVRVLDRRIVEKDYGPRLRTFLAQFSAGGPSEAPTKAPKAGKPTAQPPLF